MFVGGKSGNCHVVAKKPLNPTESITMFSCPIAPPQIISLPYPFFVVNTVNLAWQKREDTPQ
jgi:hypothetical protein